MTPSFVKKCIALAYLIVTIQGLLPNDWNKNSQPWDSNSQNKQNIMKYMKLQDVCPDPEEPECGLGDLENMVLKRKNFDEDPVLASALRASGEERPMRTIPYFHSINQLPCSCGVEYRLVDLGYTYYPRYLRTAVCRPDGCWGGPFQCRQRQYKIRVLRQREEEDNVDSSDVIPVPESLRDNWVAEIVKVTVACECAP